MSEPQPLIGILSQKGRNPLYPFGEQTGYFRNLIRYGRTLGVEVIVFTSASINLIRGLVMGHTWLDTPRGKRGWVSRLHPIPKVIYDRTFYYRGCPYGEYIGKVLTRLKEIPGVRFINPIDLMNFTVNKQRTAAVLKDWVGLTKNIPASIPLRSLEKSQEFISSFSRVFIKPNFGSAGEGIHTLEQVKRNFLLKGYNRNQVVYWVSRNLGAIDRRLARRVRPTKCILQAGLDLAKFQGRPFDVRVLVQKNRGADWDITGYAARLAGRGGYLTNLHRGGMAQPLEKVLVNIFGRGTGAGILDEVKKICLNTVTAVENKVGPFGEVAVDLGVDKEGRLWIIELNSRPGRTIFQKIGARSLKEKSITNVLEYGQYLLTLPFGEELGVGEGIDDTVDSDLAGEDVAGVLGVNLDEPDSACGIDTQVDTQLT